MSAAPRKVCVVVASRANYARVKYLMAAVAADPRMRLQLIVGASALLHKFGRVVDVMAADGFKPDWRIHYLIEGENLTTQAKSTGMGIIELSTAFQELAPDVVVTVADRYETMATAIAASYMNIPLAHVQGGEVSGNIDDSVRHAITKLAHLHYPSTAASAERLIRMGEEPWRVVVSGCPAMDILANVDLSPMPSDFLADKGTGVPPDLSKPYILVVQHPETTSYGDGFRQMSETVEAMRRLPLPKIVLWPNPDAGCDDVSKVLRLQQNRHPDEPFSYHINFPPEVYARLLANAACVVGNSSSFIREGSFLGTPAVIVGTRQRDREHGPNVLFADHAREDILDKARAQIAHGRYPAAHIFGDGRAGARIAAHLAEARLDIVKRAMY